jgi:hypothetical protein
MTNPAPSPRLQRFIDDELARAPLLVDEVLQKLLDAPLRFDPMANSAERMAAVQAQENLQRQRPIVVQAFARALREQVTRAAKEQAAAVQGLSLRDASELNLSLVDDDEIAVDVELSRLIELVHSTAEYELRELRSFTAALCGDVNVAYETNPFTPEAYGRAMLAAVREVKAPIDQQLHLIHEAAIPLAHALRKAYAGACTRLEDEGIEPAAYRTIVMPPGQTGARVKVIPPPPLNEIRDTMPVPLDDEFAPPPPAEPSAYAPQRSGAERSIRPAEAPQPGRAPAPASKIDHQVIELLTRLFDVILADRSVAPDVQLLLSRLQPPAVRIALRDDTMLERYDHPVWEFMDRLAFEAERLTQEPEARERLLGYVESVLDNLVAELQQDATLYRWGLERLTAFDRHLLEQQCQAAKHEIDSLRTLAISTPSFESPSPSAPQPLDVGSMETVPAELMDLDAPSPAVPAQAARLPEVEPGEWVRVFLQGMWRELRLLWKDARGEFWLFRQPAGRTWAVRRRVLERLNDAGLIDSMSPPSLVQHAAQRVLRQIPGHQPH